MDREAEEGDAGGIGRWPRSLGIRPLPPVAPFAALRRTHPTPLLDPHFCCRTLLDLRSGRHTQPGPPHPTRTAAPNQGHRTQPGPLMAVSSRRGRHRDGRTAAGLPGSPMRPALCASGAAPLAAPDACSAPDQRRQVDTRLIEILAADARPPRPDALIAQGSATLYRRGGWKFFPATLTLNNPSQHPHRARQRLLVDNIEASDVSGLSREQGRPIGNLKHQQHLS